MSTPVRTMLPEQGLGLLDMLPLRASGDADETTWSTAMWPLDASMHSAVVTGQAQSLLRDALELVESRLTGSDAGLAHSPLAVGDGAPAEANASHVRAAWQVTSDATLEVTYRAPLAAEAVELLSVCVRRVLRALVAGEPRNLIEVMDASERQRQLVDWNRTQVPRTGPDTVHGRFAGVCQRSPDAIAVIDGTTQLRYAELDRRANALARRLQLAGVCPGDIVALASNRSAAVLVAVLGVLKAGAAYLPVDPAHPAERLRFTLDDAGVKVAIVEPGCALSGAVTCVVVGITDADAPDDNWTAPADVTGDSLAYVMYTSGSTGVPKGVEIRHRSIQRLVVGVDYVELGADTRFLHAAPLGFDASTLEIWGPLLNGGCVVLHDEPVPTASGLARTIRTHGVTSAWLTAALFNAVVDEDSACLDGLRELFTGGEALSVDHVRRMRKALPTLKLRNGYGPTECTTFTCTHAIDDVPEGAVSIPIGRPIANTRLYVLNGARQPVPVGMVGELYVGGEGLARGYLGQPALTAERFVEDPLDPGERLYRTGDLVRYRQDGVVEFVGRADTQVKIRGFRIEPGEIEAALAMHPGVQSCAVIAREAGTGGKRLVAYYAAASDAPPATHGLRAHLAARLPEFMVPARYILLDSLPVTANGKLDRRALPAPDRSRPELANPYEAPASANERAICDAFASLLDLERVGRQDNFFDLGGNSLLGLRVLEALRARFGTIAATLLFANPTPARLASAIASLAANTTSGAFRIEASRMARPRDREAADEPIAIIAMAARLPGAEDVDAFWRNLCAGLDSITQFQPGELDPAVPADERNDPAYVAARGVIEGFEQFDAAFFGISGREAELMDPQQRIFLELCWECLERGGHAPDATEVPVGVFAGMYNATYFQRHLTARKDLINKLGAFQVMLDNEKDYIASRVAHKLNLTGPSVSVHTACSTSLVAICQAVDSLRAGRCGMALAGGASVTCPPRSGYLYQEGSMLSPDGHTRTFDARAKGTVFSDGAAVVLLKRLSDALADGDPIHAVIRGIAVNNDGGHKASFTAPSSEGQAAVIAMALDDAGVDARSIGYVEAHGTATPLGDPIEIEGLNKAFRRHTQDVGFCRIGSAKSNIGHTVIAAGATGVIKAALSLQARCIPGMAHFEALNPAIDFEGSPFVVDATLTQWDSPVGVPRRAGVSSFGVGGTNAHVVLEEAPERDESEPSDGACLIALSARSAPALERAAANLATHLEAAPEINLADVGWTLAVGRKAFAHRLALAASNPREAAALLRQPDTIAAATRSRPTRASDVVFMFPGQGATYPGMGRMLHAREPSFRSALDACCEALGSDFGFDLRERMFNDAADAMLPTAVMQPATFAIEYALAQWWLARGVAPVAMLGHSVGEFVAATLAGVFDMRDAMRLVALRGALMQAQPAGAMLSVRLQLEALLARMPATLSLAAENGPGACVVAGPIEDIARFQSALEAEGVACRTLRTSHAFHSKMMDPVVQPFLAAVAAVPRAAPQLPLASTVSGAWLDADAAMSAEYWARHLREPVRFAPALGVVLAAGPDALPRTLLEVGPRATLCGLSRQHPQAQQQRTPAVSSLGDQPADEPTRLRNAFGQLWCHGAPLDLASLDQRGARRRVCLPTYPFERQRYWVEAATPSDNVVPLPTIASRTAPEPVMPIIAQEVIPSVTAASDRKPALVAQLRDVFEDVSGIDMADADPVANFIELGLDSLILTQLALQLQKTFSTKITFRQLMGECSSLERLSGWLESQLPVVATAAAPPAAAIAATLPPGALMPSAFGMPAATDALTGAGSDFTRQLIVQQMQLMAQQIALLSGHTAAPVIAPVAASGTAPISAPIAAPVSASPSANALPPADPEEAALAHTRYDVKKAFGAIARIDNQARFQLSDRQQERLDAFIARYVARTRKSKAYTHAHRAHMADPRVVNGFRPLLKEIIYQIVVERSKGAYLWDLDGNDYVDALNGFGMSLFGWQPDFVLDAVKQQLELGYEIGPQHPLAGEVAQLVCEVTGHDRAALCNTGSEAVLGALRIARTVTGRSTIALFTGSYHGIIDEMIVRGTKKLRAVPAAPGILRNTAENVLVLEYGTPESMQVLRERAGELAAVLVEPVQSRRPDFQPREFLQELRQVTRDAGALLVFDEVVTGFRAHPRGAQGVFDVQADLATYGKVVGGGFPIGVIAGKREYMDALDGGHWQFGDDSTPSVGVTYFAGTFVRHPLALAAAKAVLTQVNQHGAALQEELNTRAASMVAELNAVCAARGAPIEVRHFASVWKTFFLEDHALQDLLFAMMRSRGVHILDNFPCFLTTAHGDVEIRRIVAAFEASVIELQEADFLPRRSATPRTVMDGARPVVEGARLGRDADGQPAWFVPSPDQPGAYLRVGS
ncbi:amino acid adenylation domain-containing protein [Thermomonas sp.]